mmetsp:Transcript_121124/g.210637  ORF Transcript_121124/g.210637 Transcript_121124/m.210637 type:complete len:89 (-) Transcript_121124:15-281(-)
MCRAKSGGGKGLNKPNNLGTLSRATLYSTTPRGATLQRARGGTHSTAMCMCQRSNRVGGSTLTVLGTLAHLQTGMCKKSHWLNKQIGV